ncbi:MAG: hypothetical protein F6K32_23270 [Desertifilum sp. SIO1I2]|nr:hypothetical protein [Desertifilum sp. SIO1I2]
MKILNSQDRKLTKRDFFVGLLAIAIVQLPQICAAYVTLIQAIPKASAVEVEEVCVQPWR